MRRMCCCTRIHTYAGWGGVERSISMPSTKGPPRVLSRTKRGAVAAAAVASGVMAKLVVSEKGTTKSFGPLPPRPPVHYNVLLLSYVAHTKREAIFLIYFASLSGLSTRLTPLSSPPLPHHNNVPDARTHTHARLSKLVRVLRSLFTCFSIYVYVYNIYIYLQFAENVCLRAV